MRTVKIHKASPTPGLPGEAIGDVTIEIIGDALPDRTREDIERLRGMFEDDAEKLFGVLAKTLPGGTLERLTGKLLQNRATMFVVPLGDER